MTRETLCFKSVIVVRRSEPHDVYIGRPSKWGNPFKIGRDGTREEVINKYRKYISTREDLRLALSELWGKRLGCYCAPLPCHGDVLAELANRSYQFMLLSNGEAVVLEE